MTQPETVFTPLEAKDMTPKHIAEAVAFAERHDRNLANRNSADAIPVPAYQLRLLSLVVKKLAGVAEKPEPVEKVQKPARPKVVKAVPAPAPNAAKPVKKAAAVKPAAVLPPLTETQRSVYNAAKGLIEAGTVVTSREVARLCELGSHNTAAKALRTLVDLGYLKRVGENEVLTLA